MKSILIIFAFSCIGVFAQSTSLKNSDTDSITDTFNKEVEETVDLSDKASDEPAFRSEDYAFDGWYNTRSIFVSCLTIVASIVSIFGIGSIWWSIKRKKISRNCQKRIIKDLIRHFIVNAAIVDGVKYKMTHNMRPEEGVFARLATLDSDTNLDRFEINSKNYEKIHNLSLSMRNYNLYVNMVEEHFKQKCCKDNQDDLLKELHTINKRLGDIVSKLWDLQNNTMRHNITIEEVYEYITEKYASKVSSIDDKDKELSDVQIPLKNEFEKNHTSKVSYKDYESFYKRYVFHKMNILRFYNIG